jgi:hypothetical protein
MELELPVCRTLPPRKRELWLDADPTYLLSKSSLFITVDQRSLRDNLRQTSNG